MATDIFISYSRKDSTFARKLVDALTAQGRNSWVDWEGIPYSADWWREICAGIDAADTFVFIISPDSLASEVCNREVDYAHSSAKRIIPVVHSPIDEKTIAGEWFDKEWEATARRNWVELKKLNWLFFRDTDDFDSAFASLIATTEQDPNHVHEHTRLLVRAREWEANGHKAAYALRGEDLREAEIWQAASTGKEPAPNDLHTAYILASQQVRKDEQSRSRALTQARFGIVLAIALFAIFGFVFVNLRSDEQTSANATLAAQSTLANDLIPTLTCSQRTLYAVPPFCDAQGNPPVLTPYQTQTPIPSSTATATPLPPTATPTSNLATQTAQVATDSAYIAATQTSSLLTATVITYTPSATPT